MTTIVSITFGPRTARSSQCFVLILNFFLFGHKDPSHLPHVAIQTHNSKNNTHLYHSNNLNLPIFQCFSMSFDIVIDQSHLRVSPKGIHHQKYVVPQQSDQWY